jgi:ATP-dependent Clp protease ATP-binding subunit ClpC
MPKINVYLPDQLAEAVKEAQLPVSAICQSALERAVREVESARGTDKAPPADGPPAMGMLFGRFTPRARTALALAEKSAREFPHDYVGTEHVLLGMIQEGGNLGVKALTSLDIELADLTNELTASMGPPTAPSDGHLPFTALAKRVLEATAKESLSMMHNYIGCEHILLGLLTVEDGLASQVLRRMGVEPRTTKRTVTALLAGFVAAKAAAAPTDLDEIVRRLEALERRVQE